MRHTHRIPSTWKHCNNCGAMYSRKAKWCPYCRDDQGHLKIVITPQTEIVMACEPAPITLRLYQKPLAVLAGKVVEAGLVSNVRAIASGESSTKLPRQLAIEIVHEIDGWHEPGRCCLNCTHEVQLASARALQIIFGAEVPA